MLAELLMAVTLRSATDPEPQRVRDEFYAAVEACGRTPPFEPGLVAQTGRAMILYDIETRAIYYPLWEDLSDDQRQEAVMTASRSGSDAETLFKDLFNSFLIAHEMGHWLEVLNDRHIDHWSSELQANRIAIAFWRQSTRDDSRLADRLDPLWAGLDDRPSPVPVDRTIEDWFNEAPFDPTTYGWYQGRMIQEAWRRRDEADFCTLVNEAWRP